MSFQSERLQAFVNKIQNDHPCPCREKPDLVRKSGITQASPLVCQLSGLNTHIYVFRTFRFHSCILWRAKAKGQGNFSYIN